MCGPYRAGIALFDESVSMRMLTVSVTVAGAMVGGLPCVTSTQ